MEKGVLRAEHVAVLFGQTDKQAILVTVWVQTEQDQGQGAQVGDDIQMAGEANTGPRGVWEIISLVHYHPENRILYQRQNFNSTKGPLPSDNESSLFKEPERIKTMTTQEEYKNVMSMPLSVRDPNALNTFI